MRTYRYVLELRKGMGFGPKSTRVIISQRIIREEAGKSIVIDHYSDSPDVPSGDAFRVHVRFGMFALDNERTRFMSTGDVEFLSYTILKRTKACSFHPLNVFFFY